MESTATSTIMLSKGLTAFSMPKEMDRLLYIPLNVEKREEDDGLNAYLPKEKFIPLIDVLRQIDRLAIFGVKFYHHTRTLHHRAPKSNALYASIIGYGCNISIPKMAKISKGHISTRHRSYSYMVSLTRYASRSQ